MSWAACKDAKGLFWTGHSSAYSHLCATHPGLASALGGTPGQTANAESTPPEHRVVIVYDPQHRECAQLVHALHLEYGCLCSFVDYSDAAAMERLSRSRPCPGQVVARPGGLTAVLPAGVLLSGCENDSEVLVWELNRRRDVWFPPPSVLLETERRCFIRLPSPGAWREPHLLRQLSEVIETRKFVVLDGFLPESEVQILHAAATRLFKQHMTAGTVHSHGTSKSSSSLSSSLKQWTARGDYLVNVCEPDPRAPEVRCLTREMDELVWTLRCGGVNVSIPVANRLEPVTLREDVMVAAYPGCSRGRYLRHMDCDRCAVLTTIVYLNENWKTEDCGQLILYERDGVTVKAEIFPKANRLVMFWSDDDNPHEVNSTMRDRFTMTIWYTNTAEAFAKHGLSKLAPVRGERHNPVAPLTLAGVLSLAGQDESRAERLAILRARQVPSGVYEAGSGQVCSGCGQETAEGASGEGTFAEKWFCSRCWYFWQSNAEIL